MKIARYSFFVIAVVLLSLMGSTGVVRSDKDSHHDRDDDHPKFRWDIISVDFAALTASAGGHASACANDNSKIRLTGSGTFVVGEPEEVTGGGTWQTFGTDSTCTPISGSTGNGAPTGGPGTYRVTRLVRFTLAPGTFPLPFDNIGISANARPGLAVLRIKYSDGSKGILVVSCQLAGTPPSVFEGVTATKGFVDYWNREAPPAQPAAAPFVPDANRTLFHILTSRGDDDDDDN